MCVFLFARSCVTCVECVSRGGVQPAALSQTVAQASSTDRAALRRPCPRFLHASAALGPCRAVRGQQTSGVGRKARARTRKLHVPASHWPLPVAALHMKVRHRECCSISRKAKSSFSSLLCCCCSLILSLTFDELCGSDQDGRERLARASQIAHRAAGND